MTEELGKTVAAVGGEVGGGDAVTQKRAVVDGAGVLPHPVAAVHHLVGDIEAVHVLQVLLHAQVDVGHVVQCEVQRQKRLVGHQGADVVMEVDLPQGLPPGVGQLVSVLLVLGDVEGLPEEVLSEVEDDLLAWWRVDDPSARQWHGEAVREPWRVHHPARFPQEPPAIFEHLR